MTLVLRPLNPEELGAREAGLDMAARLVGARRPLVIAHVQALYDVLLESEPLDEPLIALGLAFGDMIVARGGFEWVRISDEYGDETWKERLNIAELRDGTIEAIMKRIGEGKTKDR
jgi:predicted metalloprotease with PDZ domain